MNFQAMLSWGLQDGAGTTGGAPALAIMAGSKIGIRPGINGIKGSAIGLKGCNTLHSPLLTGGNINIAREAGG